MTAASPAFLDQLKRFARGESSLAEFGRVVDRTIGEGPRVVMYDSADPDLVFSAELEAGFYLDMVVDDGPEHDPDEARRLAGTLAVLLASASQADESLGDLMTLSRWKQKSAERLRAVASGQVDRAGFERFVERRPWSDLVKRAILSMSCGDLGRLAAYLDTDDWDGVRRLVNAAA